MIFKNHYWKVLEFWLWSWPFLHFFIEIEKLLSKIWWLAGDFALWRAIRQEMSAVLDRTLKNISGQVIKVGFMAYVPLQHFCSHFEDGIYFAIMSILIEHWPKVSLYCQFQAFMWHTVLDIVQSITVGKQLTTVDNSGKLFLHFDTYHTYVVMFKNQKY